MMFFDDFKTSEERTIAAKEANIKETEFAWPEELRAMTEPSKKAERMKGSNIGHKGGCHFGELLKIQQEAAAQANDMSGS